MLFSIPPFLASCEILSTLASSWRLTSSKVGATARTRSTASADIHRSRASLPLLSTCLSIAFAIILTPAAPIYNRTWQLTAQNPADLRMQQVLALSSSPVMLKSTKPSIITSFGMGAALQAIGVANVSYAWRARGIPIGPLASYAITAIGKAPRNGIITFAAYPCSTFTPVSFAGLLSTHWPPQNLLCDYAGQYEITKEARKHEGIRIDSSAGYVYRFCASKQ